MKILAINRNGSNDIELKPLTSNETTQSDRMEISRDCPTFKSLKSVVLEWKKMLRQEYEEYDYVEKITSDSSHIPFQDIGVNITSVSSCIAFKGLGYNSESFPRLRNDDRIGSIESMERIISMKPDNF